MAKVAQAIKSEVEEVLPGVTINLQPMTKAERLDKMQNDNYDIALTRWGPDYADPMTYLGMWITNNSNNYGFWSNAEYDQLIADRTTGAYISDRIGVLHLGYLVESGTKEEIFGNPIHPYTKSLLSAIPHPNPVVEKQRTAITYNYAASGIDYTAGTAHLVGGTHTVLATDEEFAAWTR